MLAATLAIAIVEGITQLRMRLRQLLRSSDGDVVGQRALEGDAGNVISYGGTVTVATSGEGDADGTDGRQTDVGNGSYREEAMLGEMATRDRYGRG
ncbi:hypothetical protein BHE74_00012120 [Ensete ventricosum]|nr:hypothetical protein GW17_00030598 [Ensete ventricosum]RWW79585.1 hypothetical protein BHE74_00012120 [Ensete ventricosum]RZR91395.1 hypothetical protein BHM03_00019507 [Ensete ventricosum]